MNDKKQSDPIPEKFYLTAFSKGCHTSEYDELDQNQKADVLRWESC